MVEMTKLSLEYELLTEINNEYIWKRIKFKRFGFGGK